MVRDPAGDRQVGEPVALGPGGDWSIAT